MKRYPCPLALAAILCMTFTAIAQTPATTPPDRTTVIHAATDMMVKARYCTLITLGNDGHPQARVVDPFPPEAGMVIWLATNPGTRKVAQIKRNPRVTLCYTAAGGGGYVTVLGKAHLVNSPAEKERRWKEEWSAFYQDKYKGSDYVLIRVTPLRMEVVSYADKILNDPRTWVPVSVTFP